SSPKCFDYNGSGGCSIARGERGCGVCEPTVSGHGHGFQLATGFIAGSSPGSDIECPIAVRCSQRFRSKFASSDRGKFTLLGGRGGHNVVGGRGTLFFAPIFFKKKLA